jgi:hypothetical protein
MAATMTIQHFVYVICCASVSALYVSQCELFFCSSGLIPLYCLVSLCCGATFLPDSHWIW